MALNVCKLNFFKRLMSISVNTKLVSFNNLIELFGKIIKTLFQVESLKTLPISRHLGDINEMLQATPELNNYPTELWTKAHAFLKQEGFKSNKFAYMIAQNPKLLTTPQEKIFTSINNWRSFQFGERFTIELLERYPEFLHMQHSSDLINKMNTLKAFVGGGSNLYKLILNSPTVLAQKLPVLNEKIDYLKNEMKVDAAEVYKCDVFSSDFMTIKTRHVFLDRLGLYIIKKKKDPSEISKNPKLYQIVETSDKAFATKICHVTLEEFETFQELYKRELDNEIEDASSDEDDYGHNDNTVVEIDFGRI